MSYEDVLGLLTGVGALAAVVGYLADVYFHPQRFSWLELPQFGDGANAPFAKAPPWPPLLPSAANALSAPAIDPTRLGHRK